MRQLSNKLTIRKPKTLLTLKWCSRWVVKLFNPMLYYFFKHSKIIFFSLYSPNLCCILYTLNLHLVTAEASRPNSSSKLWCVSWYFPKIWGSLQLLFSHFFYSSEIHFPAEERLRLLALLINKNLNPRSQRGALCIQIYSSHSHPKPFLYKTISSKACEHNIDRQ